MGKDTDKTFQQGFDEFGRQIPQRGRIEIPIHMVRKESTEQKLARLVRTEVSRLAVEHGLESIEEADDFDIDDDDGDYMSPYEISVMQEEQPLSFPDKPKKTAPADDKDVGGEGVVSDVKPVAKNDNSNPLDTKVVQKD